MPRTNISKRGSRPKKRRKTSTRRQGGKRTALLGVGLLCALALGLVWVYSNQLPLGQVGVKIVVVEIASGAGENPRLGFEPAVINIVIGENNTVVWKNEDSDWHTAHSNIPEFYSGIIQPGASFTHTFQRPGTFPYHCDPHPWMTGLITVQPQSTSPAGGLSFSHLPECGMQIASTRKQVVRVSD